MSAPACDMRRECAEPVAMIDGKGYVYCAGHGAARQMSQPCRKLRPHELRKINRGEPIAHY